MNSPVLPILCAAALAVMAGAAASHYASVRQMTALADAGRVQSDEGPRDSGRAPQGGMSDTKALIAELRRQNQALESSLEQSPTGSAPSGLADSSLSGSSDTDLKRLLAELVGQNRDLRNQVAETNRDLMELQFQVDTHSEQFRPLNMEEKQPLEPMGDDDFGDSIGVLPPLDAP